MTSDEYDDLAARVSALESQVRSLRARAVDHRGEFARVHEQFARVHEELGDLRAVAEAQSLRLDQHYEFHQAHAAGLARLSDDVREILRRLDAA